MDELLALTVLVGLVALPYWAARLLVRIGMPLGLRLAVVLAVPAVLVWWLGTSPESHDITVPGAALIPTPVMCGWVFGASSVLRRRLIVRASGGPRG
jgi:hypothetical protein